MKIFLLMMMAMLLTLPASADMDCVSMGLKASSDEAALLALQEDESLRGFYTYRIEREGPVTFAVIFQLHDPKTKRIVKRIRRPFRPDSVDTMLNQFIEFARAHDLRGRDKTTRLTRTGQVIHAFNRAGFDSEELHSALSQDRSSPYREIASTPSYAEAARAILRSRARTCGHAGVADVAEN